MRDKITLPQGVRDILPDEARKIALVEDSALGVFSSHGFERVITPLLEYVDVLTLGMGSNLKDRVLKFIEPSTGRIMAIRPDITPQIARVAATRLKGSKLPLKLCYSENILRCDESGKSKEVIQTGAEYITAGPAPETDAEMVVMAIEAIKKTGLKDFKIDIGDVGFLRAILGGLKITDKDKGLIKQSIAKKDSSALERQLDGLGNSLSKREKGLLMNLTTLYGEADIIEKAKDSANDKKTSASLEYLGSVTKILENRGFTGHITIDLGEVRGFDYYTGIIFEGFARGIGSPILSGGRYDTLLEKYGYPSAATGFAFDIESIVAALDKN